MNRQKLTSKKILKVILIVIAYLLALYFFYLGWRSGAIESFVYHHKIIAPLIYIFVAQSKAIFPVVPGEVIVVMGVVLFGPVLGFLYAVLGLSIGSAVAFYLARKFGKPFVRWFIGEKRYKKIDKLSGEKTLFAFFIIYLLPGTPDDFVTYFAGLTEVPFVLFLIICVLGRLPSYIVYAIGGTSLRNLNLKLMLFSWAGIFALVGAILLLRRYFEKRNEGK